MQKNDIALTHKWGSWNSHLKRTPNIGDPKEPHKDFDKGCDYVKQSNVYTSSKVGIADEYIITVYDKSSVYLMLGVLN